MSRLAHEIEYNESRILAITNAIAHIEVVRDLGPDGEHIRAMGVAIDCMRGEHTRLLSHVNKLRALQESEPGDPVADALKRQRADLSGYDVVADATSTVDEYEEVRF